MPIAHVFVDTIHLHDGGADESMHGDRTGFADVRNQCVCRSAHGAGDYSNRPAERDHYGQALLVTRCGLLLHHQNDG